MKMLKPLFALLALCGLALPAVATQGLHPQPSPSPSPYASESPKPHDRSKQCACGDIPVRYDSTAAFRAFSKAYALLDSPNFNVFKESAFTGFGHSFAHRLPQRKLAAQLAIYGYDFIGTYRGYLLFYRRSEGWWGRISLPALTAPNGERLPPVELPSDLNPEWPAPGLVVSQAPFIGGIVLPQQIIAFPCEI